MAAVNETVEQVQSVANQRYKYGFVTFIDQETAPKGLSEDIVRFISAKKNEPEWLLDWRLRAYRLWEQMETPSWAKLSFPPIDYQDAYYYAAPKQKVGPKSLDEVDPQLLETYNKLGIPLHEQEQLAGVTNVAVDAVFDSVSVATTFREKLAEQGVIFCSISEAVQNHPDLVRRYLGSVVPYSDKLFRDVEQRGVHRRVVRLHPEGRAVPDGAVDLFSGSTRRIPASFERTLIIAEEGSYVSYLEGCTAPQRDEEPAPRRGGPN